MKTIMVYVRHASLMMLAVIGTVSAQDMQKFTEIGRQINEYAGILAQLTTTIEGFGSVLPGKAKEKMPLITSVSKDGATIMFRTASVLQEIGTFKERGLRLSEQVSCLTKKITDAAVCTKIDCENQKACVSAALTTVRSLIEPALAALLAKQKVAADGKKELEQGILFVVGKSQLIPQEKRDKLQALLIDYTTKLYTALDFLSLLSFVVNPVLKPAVLTEEQAQEFKAEPIVIEQEEEFAFE